ncbi:hypothetical protein Hanom_Chr15g01340751 [Helianthus anomalus]
MYKIWCGGNLIDKNKNKLLKCYLRFDHFCRFSTKLKSFESGYLWFQFCCHFHPKAKSGHIF